MRTAGRVPHSAKSLDWPTHETPCCRPGACDCRRRGPRPLAITHVNVIDATGAPVRQDIRFVVTGRGNYRDGSFGYRQDPPPAARLGWIRRRPAPPPALKTSVACQMSVA